MEHCLGFDLYWLVIAIKACSSAHDLQLPFAAAPAAAKHHVKASISPAVG